MFKKLVIVSAIIASSSTLAFTGAPYVGASVGVNHQMFELQDKLSSVDASANFGGTGALINLNAGYGALLNQKFYLGAELLANGTTSNVKGAELSAGDELSAELKFKTKYTYGASIIPGFMLNNNTMAYARVGVVRTRFDVDANFSADGIADFSDNQKDNVTGGQFGLGLQTKLTNKLDIRGEYVYTAYRKFDALGVDVDPSSGQATLGIVYKI